MQWWNWRKTLLTRGVDSGYSTQTKPHIEMAFPSISIVGGTGFIGVRVWCRSGAVLVPFWCRSGAVLVAT